MFYAGLAEGRVDRGLFLDRELVPGNRPYRDRVARCSPLMGREREASRFDHAPRSNHGIDLIERIIL